jgi:hypothetical protein
VASKNPKEKKNPGRKFSKSTHQVPGGMQVAPGGTTERYSESAYRRSNASDERLIVGLQNGASFPPSVGTPAASIMSEQACLDRSSQAVTSQARYALRHIQQPLSHKMEVTATLACNVFGLPKSGQLGFLSVSSLSTGSECLMIPGWNNP